MKLTSETHFEKVIGSYKITADKLQDEQIWNLQCFDSEGEVRAYQNVSTKNKRILHQIDAFIRRLPKYVAGFNFKDEDLY